jgi:site-specific recombinase XerD
VDHETIAAVIPKQGISNAEVSRILCTLAPEIVARTNEKAVTRFVEFFVVAINNKNTRDAYYHACCRFLAWCDSQQIADISAVGPLHVAAYLQTLADAFEKATIKQHLAAIRTLFNWLVTGQVLATNPAVSVKGPKHDVTRGLTPILTAPEVGQFLDQIDTSTAVGLRDRALVGLMVFSFARISAALMMRVDDYFAAGGCRWLRLKEKGGKIHEMPVHPVLESYIDLYIQCIQGLELRSMPLFRATASSGELVSRSMSRAEAYWMVRRRAQACGLHRSICCHSFRATGITIYLNNGGTLENAQAMAGHRRLQTTKLYDRRSDAVTLTEVERIRI